MSRRAWESLSGYLRAHALELGLILLLHAATTAYFLFRMYSITFSGVVLDDAWIHFVYARSLAEHGALWYNAGVPEAGATSLLWPLLLAFPTKIGIDPVAASKALGVLFAVALSLVVYHFCLHLTGRRGLALAAGCFVAVEPILSLYKVSGMEVTLAAFLVAVAAYGFLRERYLLTGVALGLAILSRPETYLLALLAGVAFVGRWWGWGLLRRRTLARGASLALPLLALAGPWAAYCLAVGGHPLPNAIYSKTLIAGPDTFRSALAHAFSYTAHPLGVHPSFALLLLLSFLGSGLLLWRKKVGALPLALAPVTGTLVLMWLGAFGLGHTYFDRYWALFYPLSLVAAFYTVHWLLEASPRWRALGGALALGYLAYVVAWLLPTPREPPPSANLQHFALPATIGVGVALATLAAFRLRWGRPLLVGRAVPLLVVALLVVPAVASDHAYAERYAWNVKNINDQQVFMGHWIHENVPEGATVAVNDAGATKYFGQRRTIDLMGTNFHQMLAPRLAGPQEMLSYLKSLAPDYVIMYPHWFPFIADPLRHREVFRTTLHNNTVAGGDTVVVYQTGWRDGGEQGRQ